jgi:hypothetical protein
VAQLEAVGERDVVGRVQCGIGKRRGQESSLCEG